MTYLYVFYLFCFFSHPPINLCGNACNFMILSCQLSCQAVDDDDSANACVDSGQAARRENKTLEVRTHTCTHTHILLDFMSHKTRSYTSHTVVSMAGALQNKWKHFISLHSHGITACLSLSLSLSPPPLTGRQCTFFPLKAREKIKHEMVSGQLAELHINHL